MARARAHPGPETVGVEHAGDRSNFRFLMLPLGVSVFADIIFYLTAFDIQEPVTRVLPVVQSPKRAAGSTEETGPRTGPGDREAAPIDNRQGERAADRDPVDSKERA